MATALQDLWPHLQRRLFPTLVEEIGELGDKDRQFVQIVALLPLGSLLSRYDWCGIGCPPCERTWLLHAFIAKEVYQFATREALYDALQARPTLRRLCGWETVSQVPSLSTFCRAFAQFAADELPQKLHEALVVVHCGPKLVGHTSHDSTAIAVPERAPAPAPSAAAPAPPVARRKVGRPKKGQEPPLPPPTRLQLQPHRSLAENLADLPRACDIGAKKGSKGHMEYWRGYKLHLSTIDGDIPVSVILTSASTHDSQVAIPLLQMTTQRLTALYALMDSAYDAQAIHDYARSLGLVPIIEPVQRGDWIPLDPAQRQRFGQRSASERVNGRLKDFYGGRTVRVRGPVKVLCHLMFGILAITALALWQRLC
jgi:DDE family transposase/transposase-like protein DUF772